MGREMRMGVILAVWTAVLPVVGAAGPGVSPGADGGQTYAMTWCAGGPGRHDGMNAGMLRVFEIELLDAPPAGAEKLPTANTRFGVIQFADEGKSRFACGLRETSRDGKKDDSFFIDRNRNGVLEDGEVLQGTPVFEGLTATEFGAMDLMLEGARGPRKHRVFVHTNKYGPLYLTSHCYTRGRIRLGDREVEATLLDYNCDGRYACGKVPEEAIGSLGLRELDYDTIGWDADGDGRIHWMEQHFVGSYAVSEDRVYRIDCTPDGLAVIVTPLDLPMGRLQMPPGHAFVRLVGPLGPVNLLLPNVDCAVPAGTYRVDLAAVWETSDTSTAARFRKIGLYFEKPWTIRAGAVTVIEPNELIVTTADEQRTKERMAAHRLNLPEVRSLLNTPLGDLAEFGIDPGDAAGKRILLCFYDPDQRPSRHVIAQLVQRHDELKRKGLVLAAVGTSSSPSRVLPFVAGRMEGDLEPVKAKWGIRSLPWLILTDAEHVVTAEGFSFEELDEKLAGMEQVKAESVVAQCTIRDPGNNPLANARVTVHPMGREYRTDGQGLVSIRYPVPQDSRGLLVYVRHRTPVWLRAVWLPGAGGAVEVRLAEALSVCGRVTDPQGRPAAGVQIAVLPASDRHVRTDPNGCFDIAWDPSWVGSTRDLCLMACDAGRNLAALAAITPETRKADLVLEPGLALVGFVQDPNAGPVPHATVRLALARGWTCGTPVENVESDSQGRWRFTALPQRQEYRVSASTAGYSRGTATSGRINTMGETASVDPIMLKPQNRSIAGVVIDVNGLPVEGAGVVAQSEGRLDGKNTTDREGRFTITGVCDGAINLFAAWDRDRRRESSGQVLNVQPDGTRHEIVMFPERPRQTASKDPPFDPDPQTGVLRYRWSNGGGPVLEGKQWQRIQTSADRPPNVELRDAGHGSPLWGKWSSPAVQGGDRWIVLTRAHVRGQYDRLVMDTDGDGRLDDETVVAACASSQPSEHSYLTAFGPIEVALDQSDGPPIVHLSFGFYGSNKELIVHSRGWFEGNVSIAGETTRCLLVDKNANGTFATYSSDPVSTDLIGLGDEEHRTAHTLGKCVAIRGGFYEIKIDQGREHVRIDFTQAQNLPCGVIRLPEGVSELVVAGEKGNFSLCPKDGAIQVPTGSYQIVRWRSERNDEQGKRWTLTGHSFDDSTRIEVAADRDTSLTVGEPVHTAVEQVQGTAPPYSFQGPRLTGRLGETVDLSCDVGLAGLLLRIRADDGSYDRTFSFEYG